MSPQEQLNQLKQAQKFVHDILLAPVYDIAIQTSVDQLKGLSERLNNHVFVKREDEQPVHSFKLRGAYNKLASLTQSQLDKGVVAAISRESRSRAGTVSKNLREKSDDRDA